jgi:hypothetical protein
VVEVVDDRERGRCRGVEPSLLMGPTGEWRRHVAAGFGYWQLEEWLSQSSKRARRGGLFRRGSAKRTTAVSLEVANAIQQHERGVVYMSGVAAGRLLVGEARGVPGAVDHVKGEADGRNEGGFVRRRAGPTSALAWRRSSKRS